MCILHREFLTHTRRRGKFSKPGYLLLHIRLIHACSILTGLSDTCLPCSQSLCLCLLFFFFFERITSLNSSAWTDNVLQSSNHSCHVPLDYFNLLTQYKVSLCRISSSLPTYRLWFCRSIRTEIWKSLLKWDETQVFCPPNHQLGKWLYFS